MSASFNIETLTFNQWLLAGFIVAVSLLLLGWICLCVFSKKFQDRWMTIGEDAVSMTRIQRHDNIRREMYAIWIGRFSENASNEYSVLYRDGSEAKAIGWEHFLTHIVWVLTIIGIIGFLSGFYNRDFWLFFISLIILVTWFYAKWKGSTILPKTED
jgi:hypothetical protein